MSELMIIDISGFLSYFFPLNIPITEDIAKSIVGLPIKNEGITIGKVDSINWETGKWFGRIMVDASCSEALLHSYRCSLEFK